MPDPWHEDVMTQLLVMSHIYMMASSPINASYFNALSPVMTPKKLNDVCTEYGVKNVFGVY
jgi:hypothetical protein